MYRSGNDFYQIIKTILAVLKQLFEQQKRMIFLAEEIYAKQMSRPPHLPPDAVMFVRSDQAALLLAVHPRSADRKLREIRKKYCIPARHPVTVHEFCRFTRLSITDVLKKLTS